MPRAVIDPNVSVSALLSASGPGGRILTGFRAGAVEVVVSPLLLDELADVLYRPKFVGSIRPDQAAAVIDLLRAEGAVFDDPSGPAERICEDPDDEYLVRLSREARVDALVTGDSHLLRLDRLLPVVTPRTFVDRYGL